MTIKGYYVPSIIWENLDVFLYCCLAVIISILFIRVYAKNLRDTKGKQIPVFLYSIISHRFMPACKATFTTLDLSTKPGPDAIFEPGKIPAFVFQR